MFLDIKKIKEEIIIIKKQDGYAATHPIHSQLFVQGKTVAEVEKEILKYVVFLTLLNK